MIRFAFLVFLMCVGLSNVVANDFESTKIYFKVENWSSLEINISENVFEVTEQKQFFQNLSLLYKIKTIEKAFKTADENLDKTYLLTFENENDKENIIAILEKQYFTDYAEKIPIYSLFLTPNDPQFPTQWNLDNIQAELAWNITTGSANVVVAITDDAIAINHPDLDANIFTNPNEIAGNGIDDDNNGYIDDVNGWDAADNDNNPSPINANNDHGTHVAGITAAVTNNTTGIASIGFNVKILPVKIGASPSGSLIGAFNGLDYAIHSGFAHVINMSWGGVSYSFTMQNLINAAFNANIVCVAASGNSNTSAPMYPAAYNHVISVGATKDTDQRAVFSNYGNTIDVMAPGQAILSTITNNAYGVKSGTSMASPLVAGLCALIISNSQGISATQVETCLKNTCDNIDAQNPNFIGQIGAGRINAFQAVQCFNTPPTANFSVNFQSICQNQNVQFSDLSAGTNNTSWLWNFGDGNTSTLQNPSHTYTSVGPFTVSLTVTNAFGTNTKTETNYINTITPTAVLSGSSNIVSGGNAYLQIQFTGNAPFSFVYTDGNTNFTETGISQNPYYFSVSPTTNTTYSLVSMTDAGCAGNVSGNASINMFTPSNPVDSSCRNGQYIIRGNQDETYSGIIELQSGDFFFVGTTESYGAGNSDLLLIRYAPNFSIIWQKTFGGSGVESIISSKGIIENSDGSVTIRAVTSSYGSGNLDFLLFNIDASNGNVNWAKTYGGSNEERGYAIDKTQDGGYLVGGDTKSFTGSNRKLYLVRTDVSGNLLWTKIFGTSGVEATSITYVLELSNQQILISGSANVPSSSSSFISKLDAQGNLLWTKIYGQTGGGQFGQEGMNGLTQKPNGNIIASGFSKDHEVLGGINDAIIMEIDSANGNVIWSNVYGGNDIDFSYQSVVDNDGNYILPFYQNSFGLGDFDMSLVKVDENGNLIQSKSFGSNAYEIGRSVNVCSDGSIISTCFTQGLNASGRDALIIKTDANWNSGCNEMDIPINTQSIVVNPQSYTFSTSTGGSEQTVNINNSNSNIVMETLCSAPCSVTNTGSSCSNGQYILEDNGHTEAQSIAYTDDGGYILAGFTTVSGEGQEDVFVTKFDDQNIMEWSKTYGTNSRDKGYPIYIAKTNSGYVVSSNSTAYAASLGALVIMNLDFSGNIVWQKKISNSNNYTNSRHISLDSQGDILVSGNNAINSAGTDDAYLMKLNALNGSLIWSTTFGTAQQDHSYNVLETDDGGYIYGSHSHFFGNGLNAKLLVKVNSLGIFQWAKTYDNDYDEAFYDYKIGLDGNIYAVGIEGNNNSYSINVSKISQAGNLIWSKNYSGSNNDIACGIEILASGEFYISGFSNSFGNGNNDLFLTKLDASGNEIWTKFYGGNANESYYYGVKNISVNELENKIHLFLNSTSFGGTDLDPYIVITDLDGNSDCNTISANWTVTIETPTVANVTGTINNLGTINNSAYLVNPFLSVLDTICTTVCDTTPILPPTIICENKLYSDTICQGNSTQITLPNGSSFSWSPNYNISNTNTADPILFPAVDTNYIVTYYNIDSCFIIDTVHIKVNAPPYIQTSFSDTTICPGICVSLNAQSGISYVWTPNTALNNPNISNPTACPTSSTQYIVSGTDANGCSANDTLDINVLACCGAFANFSVSDSIICVGESISVANYSIINPPAIHSWTFNGATPLNSNLQNPTSITYNIPGVYQIKYILTDACGTDTVEKTIYVNDLPYLETANDTLLCDSTTLVYDLGGLEISNYNYLWTPNTGLNFNDIANPTATINNSQQYIVTVTDEFTSCFKIDTVNITFQNLPTHFIQNPSLSFCLGDTLNLSSHFFFDSIVWNGSINETTIQFPLINDTLIYATGYLGECFVSDTFLARADTLPTFIFVSSDTSICLGDNVVLSANSIFPVEWNTSETSNDINVSPTTNSLYFVNAINGFCALTDSILVTVLPLPTINISAQDTACVNSLVNLTATGGNSYLWTNADNLTGPNNTITLNSDTVVYLTGTAICSNLDSLNIYAVDSNQIFINAEDTICEGETITLTAASNSNILWNTNETTHSISVQLFSNTVFTASTNSSYCPNVSDNFEIIVIPFPNLNVTSPIEATQGEIVILEASGANNYLWSPSEGLSCISCENPSLTAENSMIYYVTSQDLDCSITDSVQLNVLTLEDCLEAMPTAFSPNGDNLNDNFYPIFKVDGIVLNEFKIYDRWGEEVHNGDFAWDGKFKNKNQALESYVYYIKYTCNNEEKQRIGNITIIR